MKTRQSEIYKDFLLAFVVLYLKIVDGNAQEIQSKIVGGIKVPIEQYPSSVIFFTLGSICGGSILNSVSVLTAAHCFDNNKDVGEMSVLVGARYMFDPNSNMYAVAHFAVHPKYNSSMMFEDDIAILFIKGRLIFSDKVKKVMLVDNNKWMINNNFSFVVTGWGVIKFNGSMADQLMMTKLRYVDSEVCSKIHSLTLTSDMFCLYGDGGKDACQGDSGGGVLWNGMLVGVVSYGDECAKKNSPSVYSNVWHAKSWIESTIMKYIEKYCTFKVYEDETML